MIIEGNFNQEFFQKVSVKDILTMDKSDGNLPKRYDVIKDENIVFEANQDEIVMDKAKDDDELD